MIEKKILRNLIVFAKNEEAGLLRVRKFYLISKFGGWFILLLSFIQAFQNTNFIPTWLTTFLAAMGGAMIGLSIWFDHTLKTWPIMRNYVDLEKLRSEDAD